MYFFKTYCITVSLHQSLAALKCFLCVIFHAQEFFSSFFQFTVKMSNIGFFCYYIHPQVHTNVVAANIEMLSRKTVIVGQEWHYKKVVIKLTFMRKNTDNFHMFLTPLKLTVVPNDRIWLFFFLVTASVFSSEKFLVFYSIAYLHVVKSRGEKDKP